MTNLFMNFLKLMKTFIVIIRNEKCNATLNVEKLGNSCFKKRLKR